MADLKCSNPDCEHSQSNDDNNFRGVQTLGSTPDGRADFDNRIGDERFYCYKCGAEASREVVEPDAILATVPERPLKSGDATNLPNDSIAHDEQSRFDIEIEEKED